VTPYELEVRELSVGGVAVVELAGELDLTNAGEVERELVASVYDDTLILDLNGVAFIDSAALHMLFRVARQIGDPQRFAIVLEPMAPIARTLEIVGLDGVATFRATTEELVEGAPS